MKSNRIKISCCIFVFFLGVQNLQAQSDSVLQHLILRRFPGLRHKVIFEMFDTGNKDTANYYTKNEKLIVHAGSINAASYALYDYVKKYCNSSLSHTGDNIRIPKLLPIVKQPKVIAAAFPVRYALNYCTYSYTMSFWNWSEWEEELDWMSLNGVNLMLAPMGTEAIWQKLLQVLEFTDREIKAYIPGPAFNAWWLMGNLQGWGGPVSDASIAHWAGLQRKILARMKELNIQPVVQGFVGIVPSVFREHFPKAHIIDQGKWCGFQRPSILAASDPLFARISDLYYSIFKKLYGNGFKYFGGDLFHEGGKTDGINLAEEGRLVQQDMQKHFSGAVWILQGWQDNPKVDMMKELDREHTLIIDLLGDRTDTWLRRNQYNNFPWIWSTVSNFGGRVTTGGTLLRVITEPQRAKRLFGATSILKGIGIIPEGIENNAIIYQWSLDGAWTSEPLSFQQRLNDFVAARYGSNDPDLNEAWQYLLQTIYNGREPGIQEGQGGYESVLCARPDTNIVASTSSWGPQKLWFDPELLLQAALSFTKAAHKFRNSETFKFDLTDTWRQIIDLEAWKVYRLLMTSVQMRDKKSFETRKNHFVELLLLQNKWLGTNKDFMIGKWLNRAKRLLPDASDKKLCELNARIQITYWGPDDRNTELHEYAYKEWNGILKDLYLKQWQAFFDYTEKKMNGEQPVYPDFFSIEKAWSLQQNNYQETPMNSPESVLPELIKIVSIPLMYKDQNSVDFFNDKK